MKIKFAIKNSETDNRLRVINSTLSWLVLIPLVLGFLLRIVLLFNSQTQISFGVLDWFNIFLGGAINDLAIAFTGTLFIYVCLITLSDRKYDKPWGYIIFGLLLLALIYVFAFHTIFDEYGSAVPKIVKGVLLYKVISFACRLFIPKIRYVWSYVLYGVIIFVTMFILLVSTSGEYFFWDEFGVRYNFIAVDYLIYTNEVVGNILESYAIIPLFSILAIISGVVTWLMVRGKRKYFGLYPSVKAKSSASVLYVAVFLVAIFQLSVSSKFETSSNVYVNELQANGINRFFHAFMSNKLNYKDFYTMIPEKDAVAIINAQYGSMGADNKHMVTASSPEVHKNIVLITEESLSASYLARYGNTEHLTPNLDKLMDEGFVFDSLFATGNRTVRGLEALTLCLPPSPGESIIKQEDNANLFSVGKVLRSKGYITQFLYGGDAYFDNMSTFYNGNGYQVIDKKNFDKSKIHFSNIWGVCDEDIFMEAIAVMRRNAQTGKPAFLHIMSISNHRPFTYPDGRIDISPKAKSRKGGVKYADYAIGKFLAEASKEPWFKNTVFIIVADHCASSAGKTEIPLDKYQIPALIYAPGFIVPFSFKKVSSQIDIMPTVFGFLNLSYESYFYGKNVLSPTYQPRAMMATYQDLGYLENNKLVVLSAGHKLNQFAVRVQNQSYIETLMTGNHDSVVMRAIANYQTASQRKR